MNGIICINKPIDFTSFDVVAIMRKLCKTKKIGHGGTLDPMAEGVLPVFVGNATRAVDFQPNEDKEYLAGFKFGITTDTQDITGKTLSVSDLKVQKEKLSVISRFTGEIEQIPPMYSAVQINGKRLYDLAREGKEVERKAKKIKIHSLKIEEYNQDENSGIMRINCSRGTYVRTLIHDIGQVLGAGAVMTSLLRTRSGVFVLDDCHELEALRNAAVQNIDDYIQTLLMPLEKLYADYPKAFLDQVQTKLFKNGVTLDAKRINLDNNGSNGIYAVFDCDNNITALSEIAEDFSLKILQRFPV